MHDCPGQFLRRPFRLLDHIAHRPPTGAATFDEAAQRLEIRLLWIQDHQRPLALANASKG